MRARRRCQSGSCGCPWRGPRRGAGCLIEAAEYTQGRRLSSWPAYTFKTLHRKPLGRQRDARVDRCRGQCWSCSLVSEALLATRDMFLFCFFVFFLKNLYPDWQLSVSACSHDVEFKASQHVAAIFFSPPNSLCTCAFFLGDRQSSTKNWSFQVEGLLFFGRPSSSLIFLLLPETIEDLYQSSSSACFQCVKRPV